MRIDKTITWEKNAFIFYQILFTYSVWECIDTSLENMHVNIRA